MSVLILSENMISEFERLLRMGAPIETCCSALGVGERTYYHWQACGAAIEDGDEEHPDLPKKPVRRKGERKKSYGRRLRQYQKHRDLLVKFYHTVSRVRSEVNAEMAGVIRVAALGERGKDGKWIRQPDHKAALAYLERRDPQNWALRYILDAAVEHSGEIAQEHRVQDPSLLALMKTIGAAERAVTEETELDALRTDESPPSETD